MPRVTYTDRFQTLLDGPLSSGDRRFVQSLFDFYKRKGRLTQGRARCVAQLEERYSPDQLAKAAIENADLIQRLDACKPRVSAVPWARDFVESLSQQVKAGRSLSPRQLQSLAGIEREYSDEALAAQKVWHADWKANKDSVRDKAVIAARYYATTGYFANFVRAILEDSEFVPTEKQYRKVVGNKYAQKVLDCHYATPKYAVGSFVALRANADYHTRQATGDKPCVVIQADAAPIESAARGAKRYKVLPVGAARPLILEERYLKAARGLK